MCVCVCVGGGGPGKFLNYILEMLFPAFGDSF